MFTHLMQIASFKSGPQNFDTPNWVIVLFGTLFVVVYGFALSLSPGNIAERMYVASFLKCLVIGSILYAWMRSIGLRKHFKSTFLVLIFAMLLAEIVKLPLSTMVRETKMDSDVVMGVIYSIPIWAIVVWNYLVWYYGIQQATARSKTEVLVVMVTVFMLSEVAGSVFSSVGVQLGGFD
ncbi:MAG: hypothetical protein A6F70_00245 [Cycloclasticus sp. symbiont of Bathymodiolus heckerae]|nr:MAG: hypothetical protein A6F70_00245 [Cycloclasticus sp. symbiont of Bathymodiolus heckerae]